MTTLSRSTAACPPGPAPRRAQPRACGAPGCSARAPTPAMHDSMTACGADVLIHDLEDYTPPERRAEARALAPALVPALARIASRAGLRAHQSAGERGLHRPAIGDAGSPRHRGVSQGRERASTSAPSTWRSPRTRRALGIERGAIEILPVCETALGVVNVREMAGASARVRCAIAGLRGSRGRPRRRPHARSARTGIRAQHAS